MSKAFHVSAFVIFMMTGCSYYIPVHAPHTPLLDHAGQVDVSARAGVALNQGGSYSVNAAYAPIDHLEVAGGIDVDFDEDVQHYGGGLAIGTFVRHDVLRLEVLAGANGGYSIGTGCFDCGISSSAANRRYRLEGAYVQPFAQAMIGFEVPYFEMAGGFRLSGFLSEPRSVPPEGAIDRPILEGYERMYIEPILTIRVPIEMVRIELTAGLPWQVAGDSGVGEGFHSEPGINFYLIAGLGVQFDTNAE